MSNLFANTVKAAMLALAIQSPAHASDAQDHQNQNLQYAVTEGNLIFGGAGEDVICGASSDDDLQSDTVTIAIAG